MGRPYRCPYCVSTRTHWKGYRVTLKGRTRLRLCRACRRRFSTRKTIPAVNAGPEKMEG